MWCAKVCALALFVCAVSSAPVDKRQVESEIPSTDEGQPGSLDASSPQFSADPSTVQDGQGVSGDTAEIQGPAGFQGESQASDFSGQQKKRQTPEGEVGFSGDEGQVNSETAPQQFPADSSPAPEGQEVSGVSAEGQVPAGFQEEGQSDFSGQVTKRQIPEGETIPSDGQGQEIPSNFEGTPQADEAQAGADPAQFGQINAEVSSEGEQGQVDQSATLNKRQTQEEATGQEAAPVDFESQSFPQLAQDAPAPEEPQPQDAGTSQLTAESEGGQVAQKKRQVPEEGALQSESAADSAPQEVQQEQAPEGVQEAETSQGTAESQDGQFAQVKRQVPEEVQQSSVELPAQQDGQEANPSQDGIPQDQRVEEVPLQASVAFQQGQQDPAITTTTE